MFARLDRVLSPEFGGRVETLPHAAVAAAAAAGVGLGRGAAQLDVQGLRVLLERREDLARLFQLARDAHGGELLKAGLFERKWAHLSRRLDLFRGVFCSR